MCTVTIRRQTAGLLVTMNRDEADARAPETPPQIHRPGGAPVWVAPHDSEKGGTWMGANELGVTACLLNAYRPGESLLPDTSGEFRSRGEIVPALLERGKFEEGVRWLLEEFDPRSYPSFTLLAASLEGAKRFTWLRDGAIAVDGIDPGWTVHSSSVWDSEPVIRWRERAFARWLDSGAEMTGDLPRFHLIQEEGHAVRSPLMRRDWSSTRSVTQVAVDAGAGRVDLRYWPNPTPETVEPARRERMRLLNGRLRRSQ